MSIRLLIAEGHPTVRAGIRALLGICRGIELVGEAVDGEEAFKKVPTLRPDIVLLDIAKPGIPGLNVAQRIRDKFPKVRVIVMSLDAHTVYIQQALRAGVAGYLLKNLAEELEPALRAVAAGGTYFSRAVTDALTQVVPMPVVREAAETTLTARQIEVLKLIAKGYTTKEIADKLDISFKTVQTHRTELMQRLDVHDVAGVVRYAIRNGLVNSD